MGGSLGVEIIDPEITRVMYQGALRRGIIIARMAARDAANAMVTLMDMGVRPFLLTAGCISIEEVLNSA